MATTVYDSEIIILIDGTEVLMAPLKIKYLRKFMEAFEKVKSTENDTDAMYRLSLCAAIAMEQYNPKFASIESIEDSCDIQTIYKIVEIAAGIKMKEDSEESVKDQATEKGSTWDGLDLAKLESEAFLLGIWKDYEELESSLSMPELTSTLEQKRENDYNDKKFLAAIQGVDLDKNSGKQDEWEQMKARVFSGGKTSDANDISTFKGAKASKAGFGLGMGLGYQDLTKKKA
jgi:hypothetical protein